MKTQTLHFTPELQKQIIQYIENNQPEFYWDYRDSLSAEQIEKIFKKDMLIDLECDLYELNLDYICDLEHEAIKSYADMFEDEITEAVGEDRDIWEDSFKDWAREYTFVDFNLKQLIRNTPNQIFFYDTGEEFEGWGKSQAEYRLERIRIKKTLGITDSRFDSNIDMMLSQASYGGQLVIYFKLSVNDAIDIADKEFNVINFSDAHIAIINTYNGSGDDCHLSGHKFSLPFDKENLFHERSVSYNYTYDVCGMYEDWCDNTNVFFTIGNNDTEAKKGSLSDIQNQEKEYQKVYNLKKCSFGDIKMNRHRNLAYINEFPCGSKCLDCGQFWID